MMLKNLSTPNNVSSPSFLMTLGCQRPAPSFNKDVMINMMTMMMMTSMMVMMMMMPMMMMTMMMMMLVIINLGV